MTTTKELVEQFTPVVSKFAYIFYKKLTENAQRWITIDDFLQEGLITIVKVAKVYDPKKSKFLTILILALKHRFSNLVKTEYTQKRYNIYTDVSFQSRLFNATNGPQGEQKPLIISDAKQTIRSIEIKVDLNRHFKEFSYDAQILATFLLKFEGSTTNYTLKDVCKTLKLSRRRLLRAAEQCSEAIGCDYSKRVFY